MKPKTGIIHDKINTVTIDEKIISKDLLIKILNKLSRGKELILTYGTVDILEIKKFL
jgi:hypothetical protein